MSRGSLRIKRLALILAMYVLGAAGPAIGGTVSLAPLNALWDELMLEGNPNSISIEITRSETRKSESALPRLVEFRFLTPEMAHIEPSGISVMELGEGFWGKGGWVLSGGVLGRIQKDDSIVELYGKAIIRRHPYIPFPFHRPIPHETGYEFILLHREVGIPGAMEVQRWKFAPQEVLLKDMGSGHSIEEVHAQLNFDAKNQKAIITISGLNRKFEEQVDLSTFESAGRNKVSE